MLTSQFGTAADSVIGLSSLSASNTNIYSCSTSGVITIPLSATTSTPWVSLPRLGVDPAGRNSPCEQSTMEITMYMPLQAK